MDTGTVPKGYINRRFRLENNDSVFQARSPIIHITVVGKTLHCSTLKDSFCLIEFDPGDNTFQSLMSDPKPRLSTCHIALPHQIIVADKRGELVGLGGKGTPSPDFFIDNSCSSTQKFYGTLPCTVTFANLTSSARNSLRSRNWR